MHNHPDPLPSAAGIYDTHSSSAFPVQTQPSTPLTIRQRYWRYQTPPSGSPTEFQEAPQSHLPLRLSASPAASHVPYPALVPISHFLPPDPRSFSCLPSAAQQSAPSIRAVHSNTPLRFAVPPALPEPESLSADTVSPNKTA